MDRIIGYVPAYIGLRFEIRAIASSIGIHVKGLIWDSWSTGENSKEKTGKNSAAVDDFRGRRVVNEYSYQHPEIEHLSNQV